MKKANIFRHCRRPYSRNSWAPKSKIIMRTAKKIIDFTLILSLTVSISISAMDAAQPIRISASAQPVPETYFGMHMHGIIVPRPYTKRVTPWPDVPFDAWRLMDAYVKWYELEPRKNEFNFERLDEYVAIAQEKHVQVLLPLVGTPPWASARQTEAKSGNPVGTAAEPADMDDWRNFVRTLATRYKGKIEAYEIWN